MSFSSEVMVHFDNVGVIALFKDANFSISEFFDLGGLLELFFWDDFDSVSLGFGYIEPFVDLAPVTFTY